MASSIIMRAEEVRYLAFGSIIADYAQIGSDLEFASRMIIIQNFTDADLMISFDGSVDHVPIKASSSFIYDLTANKTVDTGFFMEIGTKINVKRIGTPTEGSIYVSSFYGKKK